VEGRKTQLKSKSTGLSERESESESESEGRHWKEHVWVRVLSRPFGAR
jgi:hypothetical protein